MLHALARSVAVGVFAAGAILGASGIASADPYEGGDRARGHMDDAAPSGGVEVKPGLVTVMVIPPGPNTLPYDDGGVTHTDDWIENF
jgi:hypothetical protein